MVETVAHTESALQFYRDPHVIVDVGGQDIKLIVLRKGASKISSSIRNARRATATSCKARRKDSGFKVENYADMAFGADTMPVFGYGCAVFLQSDIVNFQRQGWKRGRNPGRPGGGAAEERFPVRRQIPNLAKLGTRFILQGGTQKNLAAVKVGGRLHSLHFHGVEHKGRNIVHEHCGESGAIGAGVRSDGSL